MTRRVFVDSAAWIALINASDSLHESAIEVANSLRISKVELVTSEFVLMEVADAFCSPAARVCTITFIDNLRKTEIVEIVPVSSALIWEGWFLYCQRKDKSWGLTDCISFIVMKQNRLTEAFTSDHHFVQAGFVSLISAI